MKKLAKILLVLITTVFVLGGLASATVSNAAYLKAVHIRRGGWGYSLGDTGTGNLINNIEKVKEMTSENGSTEKASLPLYYCIKAGVGFGAGNNTEPGSHSDSAFTTTYTERGSFLTGNASENKNGLQLVNGDNGNYLTEEAYYKLIYLIDNLYTDIGKNDKAGKQEFLRKAINYLKSKGKLHIHSETFNPMSSQLTSQLESTSDLFILTDDDIDVVQQLAAWHFSNPYSEDDPFRFDLYYDSGSDKDHLTLLKLINGDGDNLELYEDKADDESFYIDEEGHQREKTPEEIIELEKQELRFIDMRCIFEYLVLTAEENGNANYKNNRDVEETVTGKKLRYNTETDDQASARTTAPEAVKTGTGYTAGPFKMRSEYTGKDYAVKPSTLKFYKGSVSESNLLTDDDITIHAGVGSIDLASITSISAITGTQKRISEITQSDLEEGIYISILGEKAAGIEEILMTVDIEKEVNDIKYYWGEDGEGTQPLVKLEPGTKTVSLEGNFTLPKDFDLALRKYITNVKRGTSDITIPNARNLNNIDSDVINTESNGNVITTAEYKHRKDPVIVEKNDIITYTFRVYNEGDIEGEVMQIEDYFPLGTDKLEFVADGSATGFKCEVKESDKKLIITNTDPSKPLFTLQPFDKTHADQATSGNVGWKEGLNYGEIKVNFRVNATPDSTQEKIFTNIATMAYRPSTASGYTGSDRDSNKNGNTNFPDSNHSDDLSKLENNPGPTGKNNKSLDQLSSETYYEGYEDDDDFEKIKIEPKVFDLALRKYISQVARKTATGYSDYENFDTNESLKRVPNITNADLQALASRTTSATFDNGHTTYKRHTKTPVAVNVGDKVVYTIRIYNEGNVDGKATKIRDYLPEGLELVPAAESTINEQNGWTTPDATKPRIIETSKLASETISAFNSNPASGSEYAIDSKFVQVECRVIATAYNVSLKNVAEITESTNDLGLQDIDNNSRLTDGQKNNYRPEHSQDGRGYEDDDDYEDLKLNKLDLALRKFITKIGDQELSTRNPQPTEVGELSDTKTTSKYLHKKDPEGVKVGQVVEYTIRVYNEGEVDGYVNEITDHLPPQLKFLPTHETNTKYGWKQDTNDPQKITTDYLSKDKETATRQNKINLHEANSITLNNKEVRVACEVVSTNPMPEVITNIADITDFVNGNGDWQADRDSDKEGVEMPTDLPGYKGTTTETDLSKTDTYYPGQQDDDDFEKLKIVKTRFDLALRKFITGIQNEDKITEVKTREPKPNTEGLKNGTSSDAVYEHTKDPMLVVNGRIVIYTIRVYNEGDEDGYASIIKDDMPEGLEFLPQNQTNTDYGWKMLKEDGTETTKLEEAKSIVTDYLSKEKETERLSKLPPTATEQEKDAVSSLLVAYNKATDKLSYRDVKVAFKVIEPNKSDRILINKAQITEDKDKDGNDVTDDDSTPDQWIEEDDDQDIEKVKVQYFDLSLRKWVTHAIVIDNGTETVTETGHKAEDDPESIVKVEIKDKKINKVTIKFKYSIRVTNEGTIAGYAKEIKDHIPEGLKFNEEDNPDWKPIDDNTITTDKLKDELLQPGDSKEVEVILTWINSEDNLGLKINKAEISEDYNEFDAPDIDSTPDKWIDTDDDQDDAPVLLSLKTGQARIYFAITGGVLLLTLAGVSFIRKYIV